MIIGLTYNLRDSYTLRPGLPEDFYGEFDSGETIVALRASLESLGHQVVEIGDVNRLIDFLSSGKSVDLVFNIAEGIWGRSREAQVPAILEAFQIPYTFSDPLTLGMCLDKVVAKSLLQHNSLPTPNYFIGLYDDRPLEHIKDLKWPLFVKPSIEGTSKGINQKAIVSSQESLIEQIQWIIQEYKQPALIEEYLPGPEFTVGILGTGSQARILGALEIITTDGSPIYGFRQKEECETRVIYAPVESPKTMDWLTFLALKAYRALGCRDAGRVDIRLDDNGNYSVLEVNPLPGMHPTHSDLPIIASGVGVSYEKLVSEILDHTLKRSF